MSKRKRSNARDYEIIIDWSSEDECYVVKIPDLPGCMCHGDSREEAARNASEAIKFYLDNLEEDGRPIPLPRTSVAMK